MGDGAEDLSVRNGQCLAGEVGEDPSRTSKTLEVSMQFLLQHFRATLLRLLIHFKPVYQQMAGGAHLAFSVGQCLEVLQVPSNRLDAALLHCCWWHPAP